MFHRQLARPSCFSFYCSLGYPTLLEVSREINQALEEAITNPKVLSPVSLRVATKFQILYLYLIHFLVVSEQVRIYSHQLCHECREQAGYSSSSEDNRPPLYVHIHNNNSCLFLDCSYSFITQMILYSLFGLASNKSYLRMFIASAEQFWCAPTGLFLKETCPKILFQVHSNSALTPRGDVRVQTNDSLFEQL